MLDSFIIEKIQREREAREPRRIPLHIEVPREPHPDHIRRDERNDTPDDGIVIVDFSV